MNGPSPLTNITHADPEDCLLVARARSGDRDALEDLMRRHQPWIYNIAVRMLYHPQDAQDATPPENSDEVCSSFPGVGLSLVPEELM